MSKLIIAKGPARSGKTYAGELWLGSGPGEKREMVDYGGPQQGQEINALLKQGINVWVCINTENIPHQLRLVSLPTNTIIEVRTFTKVWPEKG